jgi:hypothetical protein
VLTNPEIRANSYVALKVGTLGDEKGSVERELQFYQHFASTDWKQDGKNYIRRAYAAFTANGPHGEHTCLVLEPMHITVPEFIADVGSQLDQDVLKSVLNGLLKALSFLHDEAGVVHAGRLP